MPAILTNANSDFRALSTGQQNYSKKFRDDGRTSFAYHLHNLHHNLNAIDCLHNLQVKKGQHVERVPLEYLKDCLTYLKRGATCGKKAYIFDKGQCLERGSTCHKVAYMQEEGQHQEKGLISQKRTNINCML